ncbi:metal ABC transporter permease [Photobacterium phosphoreum]|uniref:metal ABC transporter permease n=1 Tax=Photobacterium phosphoreum TaxID=659 RepID=UPI000D17A32C|nr:metal ABC transporter permease [Photobacterium phosphoreum]PSU74526.1 zinc ABC transporter permease [Photobacterium phosphoreum]
MTDVIHFLIQPFSDFNFMQRALWGCLLLSISGTPIGVFLTLRRMSLTGDAMSHAILPGAAIGFLISGISVTAMTIGGVIAGCIVAILAGIAARHSKAEEDASMAAFYLLSLALGVLIISSKGSNMDLLHVLFGSTLALNNAALILLTLIALITVLTLAVLYRPLVMECVDPAFFKTVSKLSGVAHYGFLLLLVLNLVAGFQALGTLMAVGLMILPATIARFWSGRLGGMFIIAFVASITSCYIGLILSYYLGFATSPSIVLVMGGLYLLSLLFGRQGGMIFKNWSKG